MHYLGFRLLSSDQDLDGSRAALGPVATRPETQGSDRPDAWEPQMRVKSAKVTLN